MGERRGREGEREKGEGERAISLQLERQNNLRRRTKNNLTVCMFVDTNRPLNRECGRLNRQTWTGLVKIKNKSLKSMPLFMMFKLLPLIYVVVVDRFIYI